MPGNEQTFHERWCSPDGKLFIIGLAGYVNLLCKTTQTTHASSWKSYDNVAQVRALQFIVDHSICVYCGYDSVEIASPQKQQCQSCMDLKVEVCLLDAETRKREVEVEEAKAERERRIAENDRRRGGEMPVFRRVTAVRDGDNDAAIDAGGIPLSSLLIFAEELD